MKILTITRVQLIRLCHSVFSPLLRFQPAVRSDTLIVSFALVFHSHRFLSVSVKKKKGISMKVELL